MKQLIPLIIILTGVVFNGYCQSGEDWFSFALTPLDTNEVEFSPKFPLIPISEDEFVSINSQGHFEVNGKELRFWGTPIYPFKDDKNLVRKEVRELRKMGVNMVRFHLMDSREWSESDIFGTKEGTRTLDPVQLDRMDFMISELKKQGIYMYIDLLCGRLYTDSDGVEHPDSINRAAKEVNFFDPQLIELQKEYASQLLTHVNPYTGLALKDDPVMACTEIVNEGWFLHSVRCAKMVPVAQGGNLSNYHYQMLKDMWNEFLIEKYSTNDKLHTAWGLGGLKPVLLDNGGFESDFTNWDKGFWGQVQANIDISTLEVKTGSKAFHINVSQSSALNYECYLKHQSLPFEANKTYTLNFWAKADQNNTIVVNIAQDREPYKSIGNSNFEITHEWKQYSFSFFADEVWEDEPHLMFYLGLVKGNLWLDDITLTEGVEEISDGGNLNDKNVKLLRIWEKQTEANRQRQLDQSEFYMKVQIDYFEEMKAYLKDEIGVQIPIAGSNFLVGIPDSYVQNCTDFIDQHGYWGLMSKDKKSMIGHPHFNNPILNLFAGVGVPGKPLTASEYNYEMPNESANEALFFLAAYTSFQDADMALVHGTAFSPLYDEIMLSSLDNYNRRFDKAMYPSFAYAYRNHLIASAKEQIVIGFNNDDVKNLVFHKDDMWETAAYPNDYPFELMYQHSLRTRFNASNPYNVSDYPTRPTNPYKSDTDEIEWDETGLFSINAPQFVGVVGKLHEFSGKDIGTIEIIEADKPCGLTLLSLDANNIGESEKMLMTFTTQQGTEGMIIEQGQVINHGKGPILLEPAKITFKLKTNTAKLKVNWLDVNGNPSGFYKEFNNNGDGTVTIEIDTYENNGLWFGIGGSSLSTETVNVTFQVDMKNETVSNSGVFLRGTFNGWNSTVPLQANRAICSTTLQLNKGEQIEYKFVNGESWEEGISSDCSNGENSNRYFTVPEKDTTLVLTCFGSCNACLNTAIKNKSIAEVKVYPIPVNEQLNISGLDTQVDFTLKLFSVDGRSIAEYKSEKQSQMTIDMRKYKQGIYKVLVISQNDIKNFNVVKCGSR